jgi:gluconokinase
MQFVLGLDIGTTHCKAIALSKDGKVLHNASSSIDEFIEQDADLIFARVVQLIEDSLAVMKDYQLLAICFSGAMHSIMAVDASGKPLTKAYTWADTRSNEQALKLRELPGIYERTGTPIHPMSPLSKICWMREAMPDVFNAAHKFISIKEYIFFKLFGKYIIDHSMASATGLFDIYSLQWNADALNAAGIDASKLSTPVPVTHAEYKDVPYIIGASDGPLANVGSGALLKGEAAITIGTSGAIRVVSTKPAPDAQQRLFNYILADGLYVTGGAISNGGAALKWFAENFLESSDINNVLALAQKSPPGANGLIFLPYLSGERSPFWDAAARGAFIGLQTTHGKEHMVRAVLEGVAYSLYHVMLTIEESHPIETLYASGAFVRSDVWVQLVADVLNKKIVVSQLSDASATGAALLAMVQNITDARQLISAIKTFEPDAGKHAVYRKYFEIYADLYPILKKTFHQLAFR